MSLSNPSALAVAATGTTSATSPSFTPTANALILVLAAGYDAASGDVMTISDTLGGLTWTQVAIENTGSQIVGAIFYAVAPASPTAGTVTVSHTSGATNSTWVQPFQVTGNATVTPIGATLAATGLSGSLSAAPASTSLIVTLSADATGGTAPNFTPPGGYTSLVSTTHTSPYQYEATAYENGSAGQTVAWTETNSNFPVVVAVEVLTGAGTISATGSAIVSFSATAAGTVVFAATGSAAGTFSATATGTIAGRFFTPPTVRDRPPYLPGSSPSQVGLWKHFENRLRGVNVFLLQDGTYAVDTADGITTNTAIPYPIDFNVPNAPYVRVHNWDGTETDTSHPNPVVKVYLGGHANPITSDEATALTAAGYGAFLS